MPDRALPASEWALRLARSARSLYAVAPAHPQASPRRDVDIVLAVGDRDTPEGWRFAVSGNDIVDLTILQQPRGAVAGAYADFLVLPPARDLPKPPAGYAFAAAVPRTGVPGVDALVDALASRDASVLTAAVAPAPIPAQHCNTRQSLDPPDVARWLDPIAARAYSLHAVVKLPDGYQPPARHLLIVILETEPYRWTQAGLLESDGRIVGILTECVPYPPRAFLVPPPAGGIATVDPARRSGLGTVDAALDALAANDRVALTAAIDLSAVGCVAQPFGIGSPPVCRADEAPGTPITVLPLAGCEGSYARRDELDTLLDSLLSVDWRLYAVVDRGPVSLQPGDFFGGRVAAVLAPAGPSVRHGALLLFFSDQGIVTMQTGCGQDSPETQLGRAMVNSAPNFLLAPPAARSALWLIEVDTGRKTVLYEGDDQAQARFDPDGGAVSALLH